MAILRFALAQFDFPVGAVAANAQRMRELANGARERGASLIAFPELNLCGYPAEDLLLRPGFLAACADELAGLSKNIADITAIVGHPHALGEVYNAASMIRDRAIVCTYHKQELPNYTVFDEKRWFRPGEGSCVFECEGVHIGLLICEDVWVPEPAAKAAAAGAQLLLVINASPYDTMQANAREQLLAQRARENDLPIAYVNVVGGQDDLLFDGASLLVAANGEVIARAPSFEEHLLLVEFDAQARTLRAIDWPAREDECKEAIIYAGLMRGVRDYVRKNGFQNVLLGLSGGIDSALTLAIAVDALGADHVTAAMLPSRYTSDLSLREAHAQAHALGVRYLDLSIEPAFELFMRTLAPAVNGELGNVATQNLQSRSRGVLLMALSNQTGALLLSTGNKSEMAVGYATLYGDMCGAYAPLKDVYKTQVYELAKWRNDKEAGSREPESGGQGRSTRAAIPPAAIERAPSAELRADQTDQDSLPPYSILDDILSRYIEEAQTQAEIIAAGFDADTVHRVVRMIHASEFKRRQSAPGPRVSTCAFGRERRYPISSGWC